MSDFSTAWNLSRTRLIDTISDLNESQLNWKIYPDALSIGQMVIHVAGVEVKFGSQLGGIGLSDPEERLCRSATDGVVNEKPFPYDSSAITPALVTDSLEIARRIIEPIITEPTDEILSKEIVSALGPIITGDGALARLAFHSAYHQGQAYLIRTAPGFPR